jgi:hypothetical protein
MPRSSPLVTSPAPHARHATRLQSVHVRPRSLESMTVEYLGTVVSAMWLTVAILAGGFARTRNRSAWAWFLLTLLFGPIAAFLLVVWPPVEKPSRVQVTPSS